MKDEAQDPEEANSCEVQLTSQACTAVSGCNTHKIEKETQRLLSEVFGPMTNVNPSQKLKKLKSNASLTSPRRLAVLCRDVTK